MSNLTKEQQYQLERLENAEIPLDNLNGFLGGAIMFCEESKDAELMQKAERTRGINYRASN